MSNNKHFNGPRNTVHHFPNQVEPQTQRTVRINQIDDDETPRQRQSSNNYRGRLNLKTEIIDALHQFTGISIEALAIESIHIGAKNFLKQLFLLAGSNASNQGRNTLRLEDFEYAVQVMNE